MAEVRRAVALGAPIIGINNRNLQTLEVDLATTERLAHLGINRDRFGVIANLQISPGIAPAALAALPDPQAAFIGGSSGNLRELLETVWARLQPGGRLVASAITEDSRVELHQFASDREAYWTELSVARAERLAGQRIMRPYLPALLMKLEKST